MPSVAKVKKSVDAMVRNDELVVQMYLAGRRSDRRERLVVGPAESVVSGARRVRIFVR